MNTNVNCEESLPRGGRAAREFIGEMDQKGHVAGHWESLNTNALFSTNARWPSAVMS